MAFSMIPKERLFHILGNVIGSLIVLVGLGFLLLLLTTRGEVVGDVKVTAILLCIGVAFIWFGCTWLFSKERSHRSDRGHAQDPYLPKLLRLRRLGEFAAVAGMILTTVHAVALL